MVSKPIALPFCHVAFRRQRPPNPAYPKNLGTLGDHIRKRRLDLGLLQRDVAAQFDVSKSGVKSLTEGLAHTLREKTEGRVSAHLLVPGFTYTGMVARFIKEKPASAWTPEQVVDELLDGIARNDFYIICPDNETTRDLVDGDRKE